MKKIPILVPLALLALTSPASGLSMSVLTNGDQGVLMVSSDLSGGSTATVTFDYDQTLGDPQVFVQGGTPSGPVRVSQGRVGMASDREDPAAAIEVEVRFEAPGDMTRAISNLAAVVADENGAITPLPVDWVPAAPTEEDSGGGESPQDPSPGLAAATVRIPDRSGEGGAAGEPGGAPARQAGETGTGKAEGRCQEDTKAVLQRFAEYAGSKGLAQFRELFAAGKAPRVRQEPPICLSDGKSPVRLFLDPARQGDRAPSFALAGAKLLSVHRDPGGEWVLTALPGKGAYWATLFLAGPAGVTRFSLVVAPPVSLPNFGTGKDDFLAQLERYGSTGCLPGERLPPRYLCEYVFTANVLAQSLSAPKKGTDN